MDGTDDEPGRLTDDVLADLHAGLLDETTTARIRRRVRRDPAAQATLARLDEVSRRLADLGESPAPAPPAEVSARLTAALTNAPAARRTRRAGRGVVLAAVLLATIAGVVAGVVVATR